MKWGKKRNSSRNVVHAVGRGGGKKFDFAQEGEKREALGGRGSGTRLLHLESSLKGRGERRRGTGKVGPMLFSVPEGGKFSSAASLVGGGGKGGVTSKGMEKLSTISKAKKSNGLIGERRPLEGPSGS